VRGRRAAVGAPLGRNDQLPNSTDGEHRLALPREAQAFCAGRAGV